MNREVFLDTSYLIAATNPRDALHARARSASAALGPIRLVTTDAVFVEFLGYTARDTELRRRALRTVDGLLAHPDCRVFHFGRTGFDAALRRYRARPDKTYSLVDCHSMVLMEERRITQVLTADDHFRQAGFTCLLPTAGGPR